MRDDGKVTYKKGVSAARHAIANGVPRWLTATPEWDALGQEICIDPRTGLPIGRISAPPELEAWQTAFIRGHNDEILRAIERGQIAVDFRPLLLTFPDVQKAFDLHRLGTLSLDHCQIEDPQGRFILHLDLPTPRQRRQAQKRKSEPCLWVVFERRSGERNAHFLNFEEPIDVALDSCGRVLLVKTRFHYFAFDIETTQMLHRFWNELGRSRFLKET